MTDLFLVIALLSWRVPLAVVLTLVSGGLLLAAGPHLRRTTLFHPWLWVGVAWLSLHALLWTCLLSSPPAAAWQLVAGCATICPLMALLGAKRPQHIAWQFVVGSLLGMLLLPALEALVFRPGQPVAVPGLRGGFLGLLILLTVANGLPTRFALASVCWAGCQVVVLGRFLPLLARPQPQPLTEVPQVLFASVLLTAAVVATAWAARKRDSAERGDLDRAWLTFRDRFGAFWALRFAERINHSLAATPWRLDWSGLRCPSEPTTPTTVVTEEESPQLPAHLERRLRQEYRNLLRRFLDPQWLDQRLGNDTN